MRGMKKYGGLEELLAISAPLVFARHEIPCLRSEQAPQSLSTRLCEAITDSVFAWRLSSMSLRGAFLPRHCEERSDEAISAVGSGFNRNGVLN